MGVSGALPGGIAQVLNQYLSWSFHSLEVRAVASTTGRGDRWMALRSARCLAVILAARLSRRPHAFVLHLSSGGSFVREGGLAAAARLGGFPVAVQLHGSDFAEFAAGWPATVRRMLRIPHRVYVLTDETEEIVRAALAPDRADRVVKVANGVAMPGSLGTKEPLVVFAGEVGTRKGADVLLRAWSAVRTRHPQWRLVLAGPVTDLPEALSDAADPSVSLLGAVPRDEVGEWQARAAIAVLPSRYEALPMSLLESMAQGCAVVATPVGDVEDLVEGCGVVVPVGDADALAAALDRLAGDPAAVARFGAAARDRIRVRFSAAAVGALLEREWTDLLALGRRAARPGREPS